VARLPEITGIPAERTVARPAPQPAARRTSRWWVLMLAIGWLGQAGLRVWFSRAQVVPLANPDESAYLIAARMLAGGQGINISGMTLYQGGYPLLITPVFWFTSNPSTAYHAVLTINALVSAMIMPLAFVACRRLGLGRPAAYATAAVTAVVPAGFFYSEYAMSDAIFPVLTLAWLLAVHSWLTATTARGRYLAAIGSALLAAYALAVHSRGLVILAGYVAVGVLITVRRLAPRGTAMAAGLTVLAAAGCGWALNSYIGSKMYPGGTRSLSGAIGNRLDGVHGALLVLGMACGQLWRLSIDSWGIAGIGLIAAVAVAVRSGARTDLRIMAGLSLAVTGAIACMASAALPADQAQASAFDRYLDGMIVTFFLVGVVVLLRADRRRILAYAAWAAGFTIVTAMTVAAYAGSSLPTNGFGNAFSFTGPAVLTQDWSHASVTVATVVALALLAVWVAMALSFRLPLRDWRAVLLAGIVAVNLVAVVQMTSRVSQAGTRSQAPNSTGLLTGSGLGPGERIAVSTMLAWQSWVPQAFEIPWTRLHFFNPATTSPPGDATVVEVPWPAGRPARASWPQAPAGWRIVAWDRADGWVAWRRG
jgi:hypothetical protein